MQNINLHNYKQQLTKELIIEEYKNNHIDNYAELSEFKLIALLIEDFSDITISKDFPKYLLLDNFDLMLEIFGNWDYNKISDNDINKVVDIIYRATTYNIDKYHLKNVIFAIFTYAPKDITKKFRALLKAKPQLLFLLD
jgi:hypothetical protein